MTTSAKWSSIHSFVFHSFNSFIRLWFHLFLRLFVLIFIMLAFVHSCFSSLISYLLLCTSIHQFVHSLPNPFAPINILVEKSLVCDRKSEDYYNSFQGRNWGGDGGRPPPPAFYTLAKDMSLNRGATHFTLGPRPPLKFTQIRPCSFHVSWLLAKSWNFRSLPQRSKQDKTVVGRADWRGSKQWII